MKSSNLASLVFIPLLACGLYLAEQASRRPFPLAEEAVVPADEAGAVFAPYFEAPYEAEVFVGRNFRYPVSIEPSGLSLAGHGLRWGTDADATSGGARRSSVTNLYIGDDPALWREGVSQFDHVRQRFAALGFDVVYRATGRRLEFDYVVAPGTPVGSVVTTVEGARSIRTNDAGDLEVETDRGTVLHRRPVAYQDGGEGHGRRPVDVAYAVLAEDRFAFEVGPYDRSRPLVIDPIVEYASYLGGTNTDRAPSHVRDVAGNILLFGSTDGAFPQPGGAASSTGNGSELFLAWVSPDGQQLLGVTIIGGSDRDLAQAIAMTPTNELVLLANTTSTDFPVTTTAPSSGGADPVLMLIRSNGTLALSKRVGLAGADRGEDLAVDTRGDAYVLFTHEQIIHSTVLAGAPTTPSDGSFVQKFRLPSGGLVYSTVLPSDSMTAEAIAVSASGEVVIAGWVHVELDSVVTTPGTFQPDPGGSFDAFVTMLDRSGAHAWSTHVGGHGSDAFTDVAFSHDGSLILTGVASVDFPLTPDAAQATFGGHYSDLVFARLSAAGDRLLYSTYFGGSEQDRDPVLVEGPCGFVTLLGDSESPGLASSGAAQIAPGGSYDLIMATFDPLGAMVGATYLGGPSTERAQSLSVDDAGNLTVVGATWSAGNPDFPATPNAFQPEEPGAGDVLLALIRCDCNGATPANEAPCVRNCCVPTTGAIVEYPSVEGARCVVDCEEGVCAEGDCVERVPVDVDDGNPCTEDRCYPTLGVQHTPLTGDGCSIGDACAKDGTCFNGVCRPTGPVEEDDHNPCTSDGCDPEFGVFHLALTGGSCEHPEGCGTCIEGKCEAAEPTSLLYDSECYRWLCTEFGWSRIDVNGTECSGYDVEGCFMNGICEGGRCLPGMPRQACEGM